MRGRAVLLACVAVIAALSVALVATAFGAGGATAAKSPKFCRSFYSHNWKLTSLHLTVTRVGHWRAPADGIAIDATETDRAQSTPPLGGGRLEAEFVCGKSQLSFDNRRNGTSDVTGQWSQSASPSAPPSGSCTDHRTWKTTRSGDTAFDIVLGPPKASGAGSVFFKTGAKQIAVGLGSALPPGLSCAAHVANGRFTDPLFRIESDGHTLATALLKAHRPLKLTFATTRHYSGPWHKLSGYSGPDPSARRTFDVTIDATLAFKPTSCVNTFYRGSGRGLTVHQRKRCMRGR